MGVRAVIVQCDACRILTRLLTHCDTLNYQWAPKNLQTIFDDENTGFHISIRKHAIDEILLIEFASFWEYIQQDSLICSEENRCHCFFAPIVCHVLGITSDGARANIVEDG
jgi:hypothetical protein